MSIPLLSALRRQPMMPLLIVVQVALACVILANVLFLLYRQLAPMLVPDGIARDQVLLVDGLVSREGGWKRTQIQAGADALRTLPGVRSVSPTLGLPMKQSMTLSFELGSPAGIRVTVSGFAGERLVDTLGLRLAQGRDFGGSDHVPVDLINGKGSPFKSGSPVIITAALARHLFPDGNALGSALSDNKDSADNYVVVGIVEHLLRYQLGELDDGKAEYAMLVPSRIETTPILSYAVRVDPQRRDELREQVRATLQREFGSMQMDGIGIAVDDYEALRKAAFKPRRAAVWLLGSVSVLVTVITALGIASLTAYWIEQRNRQIGIRRALGATRGQILRHFQAENLLLTLLGLLLGLPLAYIANLWLMQYYELPRLPLHYLPIGAALLWGLGQFAVFWPARRAAAVPPAVATRSA